jgi:glutathione peroxidase
MFPYDLTVSTIEGREEPLSEYRGSVLLVVNVASKCGLTPQYEGLEELYAKYRDQGLVVLGFPCNQFAEQEPGSNEEIAAFCRSTYAVDFPMFAKVDVNGAGRHPLYRFLTTVPDAQGEAGDVQWNFEKFLVARDGGQVLRFRPLVDPLAPELVAALEGLLGE